MDDKLLNFVVQMVKQGKLPQLVFRYRSINKWFDDILSKNELWFSKGTEFNDPFDCNIEVDTNNSAVEIRQYITSKMPLGTSKDVLDLLDKTVVADPDKFHQIVNKSVRKVLDKRGIACFSKTNNDILLWSHYADYHRGCVLTFDVLQDPGFFLFPFNVIYQADYPDYNHLKDSSDPVTPLIRTKALEWKYEEEIRVVKDSPGPYKFSKNSLVEIIFGWRTPDSEIDRIQKLAKCNNYDHIVFKKAQLKKKQFGLDIVLL
jgi:hypothetical protein